MTQENGKSHLNLTNCCQYQIKTTKVLTMKDEFTIICDNEPIVLEVEISADFEKVPEKYREMFLNMMTSKYMNVVTLDNNIYSNTYVEKKVKKNFFKRIFNL